MAEPLAAKTRRQKRDSVCGGCGGRKGEKTRVLCFGELEFEFEPNNDDGIMRFAGCLDFVRKSLDFEPVRLQLMLRSVTVVLFSFLAPFEASQSAAAETKPTTTKFCQWSEKLQKTGGKFASRNKLFLFPFPFQPVARRPRQPLLVSLSGGPQRGMRAPCKLLLALLLYCGLVRLAVVWFGLCWPADRPTCQSLGRAPLCWLAQTRQRETLFSTNKT